MAIIAKLSDPSLLILFGSVCGILGSSLLGIDALGAPDFLAALAEQEEKGFRMAQLGFIALVNRTFVYLFVSLIALPILIVTSGNLVFSMLIAPLIYFGWQMIVSVSERVAKIVELLGPRDYSATMGNVGCILVIIHWAVWVLPYITVFLLALVVRFGLDLPLTYLSEKLVAPLVMRVYKRAARIVAEEKKWKIKHTAFVGSILILFGFLYQFIATVMLIKW